MAIKDLVSQTNSYIEGNRSAGKECNRGLVKNVGSYITRIFDVLGLIDSQDKIGFPSSGVKEGVDVSYVYSEYPLQPTSTTWHEYFYSD